METPEKIYLFESRSNNDLSAKWLPERLEDTDIEYTLTDAFIEKAVKFLKNWDAYRVCLEGHKDWFIEQFKKHMKGGKL